MTSILPKESNINIWVMVLTIAHYYYMSISFQRGLEKEHDDPLTHVQNRHKIRMPLIYRFLSGVIAFAAASLVLDIYASTVTPNNKNYDKGKKRLMIEIL